MQISSISTWRRVVPVLACTIVGGPVAARTLTLTADRLQDVQASASGIRLVVVEQPDSTSLQLRLDHLEIQRLGVAGRLDWTCPLRQKDTATRVCAGPARFVSTGAGSDEQAVDLAVEISGQAAALSISRDAASVSVTIPFTDAAPLQASLKQVPVHWLKTPLALAWTGGELREGVIDADAQGFSDGRIDARYRVDRLDFNTLDGTASGNQLAASGQVAWSAGDPAAARLVLDATFTDGTLRAGAFETVLPQTPVAVHIDATPQENGRWDIAQFSWQDPGTLELSASGQLQPAALAPLRRLDLHVERAHFPLAAQRYGRSLLAAQGLGKLALRGDLAGDIALDATGIQRIALTTGGLDIDAGDDQYAIAGLKGGIDWSSSGERDPFRIGWRSARIAGTPLASAETRWQSRGGALHLLGRIELPLLGGRLGLAETVLHPLATTGERLSTAFTLAGLGYDDAAGALAAAHLGGEGRLRLSGTPAEPQVEIDASLRSGELLAGPVYVKLPEAPVTTRLDAALVGANWQVRQFEWRDAGVLDFDADGEIAPADANPLRALRFDIREAQLAPALDRYARSWLAAKGYPELVAEGSLSGSLRFDADGLQRFSFAAKSIGLRDGGGRFVVSGLDGGIDWRYGEDSPPTRLGWRSIELFKIPLGAAQAALESGRGAIVLAEPLPIDVLGGQLRLEKLSLQPRSPRGERYAGSFAIVGIDMTQLSAALGWPSFGGNLSGGIPEIELAGDTIELRGGLDLYVFDGHLGVSGVSLERPFGVAPSLGADIHFENFDMEQVTHAFSFGGMSGRLDGTIGGLRLVDWSPVAFDAWLRTRDGGRMSYKAVNDLTAIGGGGLSDSLQTMALKIFDTFGFRRLGIRCRLADEVCAMAGIDPAPLAGAAGAVDDGYTIVEGSGIPRIQIVGHRRRVDWPTLIRRLIEATQGQAPIIR